MDDFVRKENDDSVGGDSPVQQPSEVETYTQQETVTSPEQTDIVSPTDASGEAKAYQPEFTSATEPSPEPQMPYQQNPYQPPYQQNPYQPHVPPQGPDTRQNNGYAQQPYGNQPQYGYNPYAGQYTAPVQTVEVPDRKDNKKWRKVFFVVLAVAVVIAVIAIPVSLLGKDNGDGDSNPGIVGEETPTVNADAPSLDIEETPSSSGSAENGALTPEQVYEKIAASNVAVIVYQNNSIYTEGTGIIMKEDNAGRYTYILTCAHVISDSGIEIVIQFEDGDRYDAQIVGYDARTDIGVLRIEATGFKVAEFGNSDALKVGSTVYAIGNPGGSALFGTFTDGKVSAIGRSITSSIGYDMVCIQHNAAISPGNSGGALVNEYGQVIGINSAKIAATEYEGISFSIPITQAQDIINKVIAYGYVPGRAKLGISYVANDSSSISSIYGMAVQMMDLPSGSLVIYSIDSDGALANTDAEPGDMIIAVNGKELDTADVLLEMIEDSSVGDTLELTLFRIESAGGKYSTSEFKVKATLVEETNENVEETTTRGVYGNSDYYGYGFDFGF